MRLPRGILSARMGVFKIQPSPLIIDEIHCNVEGLGCFFMLDDVGWNWTELWLNGYKNGYNFLAPLPPPPLVVIYPALANFLIKKAYPSSAEKYFDRRE